MEEIINQEPYVVCPHCGAEYLPSEIFIEDGLLGDAHDIVKTSNGKIAHYLGKPYDLQESYVCDYCNKEFKVNGTMLFTVDKVEVFEEEYEKQLYTDRIQLEEN